MAKEAPRRTARKVKDKWKAKTWYKLLAPEMFSRMPVGETPADDPEKLLGRLIEVSYQDISGDFSKLHIKLYFRVNGVKADECSTQYAGHNLSNDYIRRLTRRKHSKMDGVYTIVTRDGWEITLKPMAITEKRIQASQQHEIRKVAGEVMLELGKTKTLAGVVEAITNGELSKMLFRKCKPIYPLKKVEIRKSEVLRRIEGAQDIAEAPVVGPPAAPGGDGGPAPGPEDAAPVAPAEAGTPPAQPAPSPA